ncbi:MAG: phage minor head protein [Thermodesulfobacteriota bacterium]
MADMPSAISGALKQPFAEQVAFFRNKLGKLVPTAKWDDISRSGHDKGFMVAGAMKADLLADLAAAADRSISEGQSLEAFRNDFMATVERRGWVGFTGDESPARRAWRTRVIYQTNCATSYAAGRLAQLKEGGFPIWVYHHSDSVTYPRPEHVAWGGLTLPADHPFWRTHYPPSAWGCHCYVLGARSDRGARRLGGDPGRQLPDGWDAIDAKSGAPAGIDKGWDYAPGESVADTVRQMAAKTQQWEYSLAKSYMQGVPEPVRDDLARAYRELPSVATDVRRYATRILEEMTHLEIQPYRTIGLLTGADAARVKELMGVDVAGYDYAIDQSAINKIAKDHGDPEAEAPRGQLAITAVDYADIPALLNSPDGPIRDVGKSWKSQQPVVKISKYFGEEELVTVWEVRAGRKSLALQSMWRMAHRAL